jgi:hypothetical protein
VGAIEGDERLEEGRTGEGQATTSRQRLRAHRSDTGQRRYTLSQIVGERRERNADLARRTDTLP